MYFILSTALVLLGPVLVIFISTTTAHNLFVSLVNKSNKFAASLAVITYLTLHTVLLFLLGIVQVLFAYLSGYQGSSYGWWMWIYVVLVYPISVLIGFVTFIILIHRKKLTDSN